MQELSNQIAEADLQHSPNVGFFVAPDNNNYFGYYVVKPEARTNLASHDLQGFGDIDISSLPTVAFGLKKSSHQDAGAIKVIGQIRMGNAHSANTGMSLDRIAFHYISDSTLTVQSHLDLRQDKVIEYPLFNRQDEEGTIGEKVAYLHHKYPDYDWEKYNSILEAKTGLNLFEVVAALTRIYYAESPLEPSQARYQVPEDFIAVKTKIPPAILPLIIIMIGQEWRKVIDIADRAVEVKQLPAPETQGLMPDETLSDNPEPLSRETIILDSILEQREAIFTGEVKPQELIESLIAQGYGIWEVKKEFSRFYLMLCPWYTQKQIQELLKVNITVVNGISQELPDWAKERRKYYSDARSSKSNSERKSATTLLGEESWTLDRYVTEHENEIYAGIIPLTQIAELFGVTKETVRNNYLNPKFGVDWLGEMKKNSESITRQPLVQSFLETFFGLIDQGIYKSPEKVGKEIGLSRRQTAAALQAYYLKFPDLYQKSRAVYKTTQGIRGSIVLENMPKIEFNGVKYDSHNEIMVSMLLQLYSDYYPILGDTFQEQMPGNKAQKSDFKLHNKLSGSDIRLEFHPEKFRGQTIQTYRAKREKSAAANETIVFVTTFREVSRFLIDELGVDDVIINNEPLSQRISYFANSRVTIDGVNMKYTEAIARFKEDPVAVFNYFQPPLEKLLKLFSHRIDDSSFQESIKKLYPKVDDAVFNSALDRTRELTSTALTTA